MAEASSAIEATACTVVKCVSAAMPAAASGVPWWWTAVAVPFLSAGLAVLGAWVAVGFDRRKSANQELIKKRIAIYDDVVPKINDLLCYFNCIGDWRSLNPEQLIDHKRKLDRKMYIYGALFSQELTVRFHDYINTCFSTYSGHGRPAKLTANVEFLKRQWGNGWVLKWNECFVAATEAIKKDELRPKYDALLNQFAIEIGAKRPRGKK